MRTLVATVVVLLCGCFSSAAPTQLCAGKCPDPGGTSGGTGGNGGGSGGGAGGGAAPSSLTDESWVGGSRIKAVTVQQSGVPPTFTAWRDTQLNADCYLFAAGDGEHRCIPWGMPYAADGDFSDASCTHRAFTSATTDPPMALGYDTTTCETRWRVFSAGSRIQSTHYFFKSGTSCVMTNVPVGQQLYALGSELSPSTFVRGTVTPATAAGVALGRISFDDGAHGTWGLHASGDDCSPRRFTDGTTRCATWNLAYGGGTWADSSCSVPTLVTSLCAMPELGVARWLPTDTCEAAPELVQLGSTLSTYYAGAQCTAVMVPSTQLAFRPGAAVPDSTFPAATSARVGAGRLQATVLSWPSGVRTGSTWFDTQLGEYCTFYGSSAATTRTCAVSTPGLYVFSLFSDPHCSHPLAATLSPSTSCAPKYAATYADASSTTPRVYTVGPRYTGTVYSGTPESCTALTASLPDWTLYPTTGELPLSELATATQTLQ